MNHYVYVESVIHHTRNYHHADGEDFFIVCFGCDVPEPHAGHTGHCEVECGDVHAFPARPVC